MVKRLQPEVIFFDFDDTLHDFRSTYRTATRETYQALRHLLQGVLEEDWVQAWLRSWRELWPHFIQGTLEEDALARGRAEGALRKVGIEPKEPLVQIVDQAFQSAVSKSIRPFPDVEPTLRFLKRHYRLGLITNGPEKAQRHRLSVTGLAEHFDPELLILCSAEGVFKPDRKIYRYAESLAGVPGHRIVMVGDSPEDDVMGAKAAGWGSVWLNRYGFPWPGELPEPDLEVPSLSAWKAWLTSHDLLPEP